MLGNFIFSRPFFYQVKYCKVVNIGMRRDHTAILTALKTTAIKFKVTEKVVAQTDWKIIAYQNLTNDIFNNSLYKYIACGTKYYNYNKHTLEAGTNTAKSTIRRTKAGSTSSATPSFP